MAPPFQPLDFGIVNEAIAAFFIGRNRQGFWVARDVGGRIGGMFLFESSALSFARSHSRPAACATICPSARFELDLENRGNPLGAPLGRGMRLAQQLGRRALALIGNTAAAIKSGRKGLWGVWNQAQRKGARPPRRLRPHRRERNGCLT
jgi:hypothetical protein